VKPKVDDAFGMRAPEDAAADDRFEELGKERDYVDAHVRPSYAKHRVSTFKDAMTAFERGDFAGAIDLFSAAVAADENVPVSLSKRGVCKLHLHDRAGARQDFEAALQADIRCVAAIVNLGNLALEAGELTAAQAHYEQALRIDETYSLAHYNLGVLLRKRGDLAASVRELRLAAKYEARPQTARKRLAFWKRR